MQHQKIVDHINLWLTDYLTKSNLEGFVVGVSGGVDSALTGTLAAITGRPTILVNMPIFQSKKQFERSSQQIERLENSYANVKSYEVDLTPVFKSITDNFPDHVQDSLSMANARARLRMTTLYTFASAHKLLVVGTGNKVEDFGVGFYTKYGDGGVDISPIADCNKTHVWELGKHLGVSQKIIDAEPTDGLWNDGRNDTDQLGMTYNELEKAMLNKNDPNYKKYLEIRKKNLHKMDPIPVCKFNES